MAKRGVKSIYNDAQWEWVIRKSIDGYTRRELAEFLGVSRSTVEHRVGSMRAMYKTPLSELKDEFNALAAQ